MGNRTATTYVDYQQRASEFSVNDLAYPLAGGATDESQAGRVVAVYPAIGQVDLEFPWGSGRYPVEDVQRVSDATAIPPDQEHSTVPGGAGAVSVSGGPSVRKGSIDRVSEAYVKSALYWASRDRHYKATRAELDEGSYSCPKCKVGCLRKAVYKRSGGKSERLLGCPSCLFLIKRCDILGDPAYEPGDYVGEDEEVHFPKTAKDDVKTRELVVTFGVNGDAAEGLSKMMAYIKKIGDPGHSFGIIVDQGDTTEKSFGYDGDGADKIISVTLDGKKVEV